MIVDHTFPHPSLTMFLSRFHILPKSLLASLFVIVQPMKNFFQLQDSRMYGPVTMLSSLSFKDKIFNTDIVFYTILVPYFCVIFFHPNLIQRLYYSTIPVQSGLLTFPKMNFVSKQILVYSWLSSFFFFLICYRTTCSGIHHLHFYICLS